MFLRGTRCDVQPRIAPVGSSLRLPGKDGPGYADRAKDRWAKMLDLLAVTLG